MSAQGRTEPMGSHVVFGVSAIHGAGLQLGYLGARDFFTREVLLHSDLGSALNPKEESNQVVFWMGVV